MLEARTLLNATIDIDAAGKLTYRTDPAAASTLRVSEVSGVYTFAVGATDAPIDVASNAAGLVVTGDASRSVSVAGPSALVIDAAADSDSILLASASAPTAITLNADDVLVTVGDRADPRGLGAVPGFLGKSVTSTAPHKDNRLVLDDRGWSPTDWPPGPRSGPLYNLSSGSILYHSAAGGLHYSGLSSVTLYGAAMIGGTATVDIGHDGLPPFPGTADGVDTRIDLSAADSQSRLDVDVVATSKDPSSRLTVVGGRGRTNLTVESTASPMTYQGAGGPGGGGVSSIDAYVSVLGTAASSLTIAPGGGTTTLTLFPLQEPITAANFQADGSGGVVFTAPAPQLGTVTFSGLQKVSVAPLGAPYGDVTVQDDLAATAGQPAYGSATFMAAPGYLPGIAALHDAVRFLWGDNSSSLGSVTFNPDALQPFSPILFASYPEHTYARSGTYTPGVILTASDAGGSGSFDVGGQTIDMMPNTFFGGDALVVSGAYNPLYGQPYGPRDTAHTARPFATGLVNAAHARIVAYAVPEGGGSPLLMDMQPPSGADGSWSIDLNVKIGDHEYSGTLPDGVYAIQVQAFDDLDHRASAPTTIVTGFVVGTPPPVVVSKTLDATAGVPLTDVVVATFDAAAASTAYSPLILWGDNGWDYGRVVADPNDPTRFNVMGSHTYAQTGSYTPGVIVQRGDDWTANGYSGNAVAVAGGFGDGQVQPDGLTNRNEPVLIGRTNVAEGGARIVAYATNDSGGAILIGQGVSGPGGYWQIQPDVPLPDGRYSIQVQAIDDAAHVGSAVTTIATGLVVDTVGPQVADVQLLPRRGQVVVSYQDAGSGLDLGSVSNAASYAVARQAGPMRPPLPLAPWTVASVVAGPRRAAVALDGGRPIRRGGYLFTILAGGVRDRAGNPLQGGFDGRFPTHGAGDFKARFDVFGGRATRPQPVHPAPLARPRPGAALARRGAMR